MDRIMSLRAKGIEKHVPSTCGSRHAEVFTDLIRKKGLLDEPMLAIRTFGLRNCVETRRHDSPCHSIVPAW